MDNSVSISNFVFYTIYCTNIIFTTKNYNNYSNKLKIFFKLSCGSGESDEDISFSKRIESISIASKDNSLTFDPLQIEQSNYGINLALAKPTEIAIYKKYNIILFYKILNYIYIYFSV